MKFFKQLKQIQELKTTIKRLEKKETTRIANIKRGLRKKAHYDPIKGGFDLNKRFRENQREAEDRAAGLAYEKKNLEREIEKHKKDNQQLTETIIKYSAYINEYTSDESNGLVMRGWPVGCNPEESSER